MLGTEIENYQIICSIRRISMLANLPGGSVASTTGPGGLVSHPHLGRAGLHRHEDTSGQLWEWQVYIDIITGHVNIGKVLSTLTSGQVTSSSSSDEQEKQQNRF